MVAPVPPGAPRPGTNMQQTPPNYNPNLQPNPNMLAGNMQNLNLNRPPSMSSSGPRPFGQQPPFPQSNPSPPMSRPGPPPAALGRPSGPPSGMQPSTFPSNIPSARPTGPPVNQPPPFGFRPPPQSGPLPSSMGSQLRPSGPPSGVSSPFPAARPSAFGSPSPMAAGPSVPPPGMTGAPLSNGPPMYGSGALSSGPRFSAVGSAQQPPFGQPPAMGSARPPLQPPGMGYVQGSSLNAPAGPPLQPPVMFPVAPQGGAAPVSPYGPPPASPYGAQTWPLQPQQGTQPRPYGMPALPNQSLTTISPAMGQPGGSLAGPSKIDPTQIPRPGPSTTAAVHETRQGNQANPPPPATSDYIVRDTGNCSPRYMRCTINQIPCTADLLSTSGMQLALMVQPLALPHSSEEPIHVVDFGESGPVRCSRCKGYINPFMKFIDQGRRFICNFCGYSDETPRDYHCNLGPDGRRRDADERPELCRGTVEFAASKEYMVRDPMPAVYFFLVDVSLNAMQTGATAAACNAINQVLSDLPEGPRTYVGIATFDSTIHFYNLKCSNQQPVMLIVPDIQDVYTPLETDIIVKLSECRQHIELLLESIPTMFQNSKTAESAFGAAIKAAFLAMKATGGKLLVFQSVLPSAGIGSLSAREAEGRTNISAGEKEAHKLLQPADKTLKTMAVEFAEYQVCIDLFITTQSYVDIASISVIPKTTGGQIYYYYPFSTLTDPAKLYNDLRWNITRPQGFEAVMRVRCSQGIQVQDYSGNFCKRIPTDIDLPAIDCDKAIVVTLKHDDKLQDGVECAFQCALLYTTVYGQRRIRITTLSLSCTNMLSNLFRSADLDAQFACLLKQAANEISVKPLLLAREQVTNACVNILLSYRKFCATVTSTGQLILPEALKLLPLFTLALIKSAGLRTDGRIDDRSFWIIYVSFLSTSLAIPLVYPRMMAIHDLDSKEDDGSIIPPIVPLSSEHVSNEGVYFLENGEDGLIYVGDSVSPDILRQLFGVSLIDEIPSQFVMQQFDNPLSKKFNDLVNEIRRQRCSYLRLKLCKKGDPSGMSFLSYMVEDKNAHGVSYVEFLVHIHRQIQVKMT